MPGLPGQITPFDQNLVTQRGSLMCRTKVPNSHLYHGVFRVDILAIDEDYYYASPFVATWYDKEADKDRRHGFLPYPKYAWKLV